MLLGATQGYSGVSLQCARTELDLATDTYTSDDVAVVRVKGGDVEDVHHGAVICFQGICAGEFAVVDGVAGPIACTAGGEHVEDELVPISFVGTPSGHEAQPERYMLSASVTDRHILLAQTMLIE